MNCFTDAVNFKKLSAISSFLLVDCVLKRHMIFEYSISQSIDS